MSASADAVIYAFAGYEVDIERVQVRHDGSTLHVEPQVFDVLCYLIANRDRVVSKIELFENVWGGAFVGESALTSRIKTARRLVGDDGQAQRVIRTVQRRGYQFVGDVVERRHDATPPHAGSATRDAADPASGTVTFLFSDIAGSSRLWEVHEALMGDVIARHDALLEEAVEDHAGVVFATAGDGIAAAFPRATDAIGAARAARSALDIEPWPDPIRLDVRLGLHTGEAVELNGNYLGPVVNRAARVMSSAHGGQTLVSDVTAGLLNEQDELTDLGICRIDPDMPSMRLWQLDGKRFPPIANARTATPPALRTALIGRIDELDRVTDAVADHRLVSIVGPGGAGKTTLALAAANQVLVSFQAGVAFVELASAIDGGGIFRSVAEAAGIEGAAAADMTTLAARLARRPVLLVLDNCEHLLDECADFVDALLDAGTEATVLTTSREPLGVDGEFVVPLGSMTSDGPELFVARAFAARPDAEVAVTDERVVHICDKLDGLPLAIELAAAQLAHLGLDDLIGRLGTALELSRGGRSRARDRHATLDDTITWSYDLLDEREQWLLRQLGVFPGSFDLAAVEAVGCEGSRSDALSLLAGLVTKSLIVWNASIGRYRLLEMIRAFAGRRLAEEGEVDNAAERLRGHVVERATRTSRLDRWLSGDHAATVRNDIDNERFAFDRSIWLGHVVDALEIHIGASYLFRNTSNCNDGRKWSARLELAVDDMALRDRLWFTLVRIDLAQGTADHRAGRAAASAAVELAAGTDDESAALLADYSLALHDVVAAPERARTSFVDAAQRARAVGDPRLEHLMQAFLAVTELSAGETARGTELAEQVGHVVDGGGYEVFIANWAAWTACLINGDAERLRYWRERQRAYLTRVGVPEPWLFLWSTALVTAMEGGDPTRELRITREHADHEGHDVDADIVLALALVATLARRDDDAAELLGVVMLQPLNNLSHYVLVRSIRSTLDHRLGAAAVGTAIERGGSKLPNDVLDQLGYGASAV